MRLKKSSADGRLDASLAVTLRFPGDRLAQFFCSFGSADTETISIVASKAELILDPAFKFDSVLQVTIRTPGNEQRQTFRPADHFAGQIAYFSDCIAKGVAPEADGEEGLAIDEAARTGETVRLAPRPLCRGIDAPMVRHLPVTDRRLLVEPAHTAPFTGPLPPSIPRCRSRSSGPDARRRRSWLR